MFEIPSWSGVNVNRTEFNISLFIDVIEDDIEWPIHAPEHRDGLTDVVLDGVAVAELFQVLLRGL